MAQQFSPEGAVASNVVQPTVKKTYPAKRSLSSLEGCMLAGCGLFLLAGLVILVGGGLYYLITPGKSGSPVAESTKSILNRLIPPSVTSTFTISPPTSTSTISPPTFTATQIPASPTPSETPTVTLSPSPTGIPRRFIDEHGVEMVLIPSGEFRMGMEISVAVSECKKWSEEGCWAQWFADYEPVHKVFLPEYYIDLTETTNASYAECVADGDCTIPATMRSESRMSYYNNPDYLQYPVIDVTWGQAEEYCVWRGARLPTEAEWEKAARGEKGDIYPWGNQFDGTLLNWCDKNCTHKWANRSFDDGFSDTAPVDAYPEGASPYGVLNMVGNVWEWVQDWYSAYYYKFSPFENPLGPESGAYRVVKGGSFYNAIYFVMAAERDGAAPIEKNIVQGLRCARTP